jgi:hypothetical protein
MPDRPNPPSVQGPAIVPVEVLDVLDASPDSRVENSGEIEDGVQSPSESTPSPESHVLHPASLSPPDGDHSIRSSDHASESQDTAVVAGAGTVSDAGIGEPAPEAGNKASLPKPDIYVSESGPQPPPFSLGLPDPEMLHLHSPPFSLDPPQVLQSQSRPLPDPPVSSATAPDEAAGNPRPTSMLQLIEPAKPETTSLKDEEGDDDKFSVETFSEQFDDLPAPQPDIPFGTIPEVTTGPPPVYAISDRACNLLG